MQKAPVSAGAFCVVELHIIFTPRAYAVQVEFNLQAVT